MNWIESLRFYLKGNYLNQEPPKPGNQMPLSMAVDTAAF